MNDGTFWQILAASRTAAFTTLPDSLNEDAIFDAHVAALKAELSKLEFHELDVFTSIIQQKKIDAYR